MPSPRRKLRTPYKDSPSAISDLTSQRKDSLDGKTRQNVSPLEQEVSRLYSELEEERRKLKEAFRQLGEALSAGTSLSETLQTIINIAVEIVQAQSGIIRLVREGRLWAYAVSGGPAIQRLREVVFNLDEGVLGEVLRTQSPVIVKDFNPEDYSSAEVVKSAGIRNLICVPLLSLRGQTPLGTLTVHNKRDGSPFTPSDQSALTAFAVHAAIAVERALQQEEERLAMKEAQTLRQVAEAAASLDLEYVLSVAIDQLSTIIRPHSCAIFLYNSQKRTFECTQGTSGYVLTVPSVPFETYGDPIAQYLRSGEPAVLHQLPESPLAQSFQKHHLADLLLPLISREGEIIGVIALKGASQETSREENQGAIELDQQDYRLLSSVSRQLAIAIEKAQLFAELERRLKELSSLYQISMAIASTLDLQEILSAALEEVVSLLEADTGSIMLYDPDRRSLRIKVAYGLPLSVIRRAEVKLGEGVAGWVAEHQEALLVKNLDKDPRFRLIRRRPEVCSALCVPLLRGKQLLGVLNLTSTHPDRIFTQEDLRLLKILAGQLAVAIQNARLYEAEHRVAQIARSNLMPSTPLQVPGLSIGEKHIPAEDVGGDYYDVFPLSDTTVGILVSDVSGRSVPAAMHAAMGKYFVHALTLRNQVPAQVLTDVNRLIFQRTPEDAFISLFFGVLDLCQGRLCYANAGHVPPYLLLPSGDMVELENTGLPLGLFPHTVYEDRLIQLEPSSVLVCYTDGILEARRGTILFGEKRLKAILRKYRHHPPQEIADRIYRRTLSFCRQKIHDDIALLILRWEGPP